MKKMKIVAILMGIVLLIGLAWVGLTSRKSAQADIPSTSARAQALQREMDETGRIVNGGRR